MALPGQAELKISANPKVVGGLAGRTSKIFASPDGGIDLMVILMVTMMMMVMMTMVVVVSSADL